MLKCRLNFHFVWHYLKQIQKMTVAILRDYTPEETYRMNQLKHQSNNKSNDYNRLNLLLSPLLNAIRHIWAELGSQSHYTRCDCNYFSSEYTFYFMGWSCQLNSTTGFEFTLESLFWRRIDGLITLLRVVVWKWMQQTWPEFGLCRPIPLSVLIIHHVHMPIYLKNDVCFTFGLWKR